MSELVSIIVPYYNSQTYVNRLINSIKNQEYETFECILVDDGSNDNSFDIVNDLIREDSRFRNLKRSNNHLAGGRGAKNFGFTLCKGEFIVFFDSDDRMSANFLKLRVDYLKNNLNKNAVISDFYWKVRDEQLSKRRFTYNKELFKDFTRNIRKDVFWFNYIDYRFYFPPGNAMYQRKFIEKYPLWNEKTGIGEDHEYHARLFLDGLDLGLISLPTFDYMFNENSMISTSDNVKSLLSRSFGKMLVLRNLLVHFPKSDAILKKEFLSQCKILRKIMASNESRIIRKEAMSELFNNIDFIISKLTNVTFDWKFRFWCLKRIASIQLFYNKGFKLYNWILFDENPTFDNTYFYIK